LTITALASKPLPINLPKIAKGLSALRSTLIIKWLLQSQRNVPARDLSLLATGIVTGRPTAKRLAFAPTMTAQVRALSNDDYFAPKTLRIKKGRAE